MLLSLDLAFKFDKFFVLLTFSKTKWLPIKNFHHFINLNGFRLSLSLYGRDELLSCSCRGVANLSQLWPKFEARNSTESKNNANLNEIS